MPTCNIPGGKSRRAIPVDLVTTSDRALIRIFRRLRRNFKFRAWRTSGGMSERGVRALVEKHTEGRQWGFLGEPRVNVLELNLELNAVHPLH